MYDALAERTQAIAAARTAATEPAEALPESPRKPR